MKTRHGGALMRETVAGRQIINRGEIEVNMSICWYLKGSRFVMRRPCVGKVFTMTRKLTGGSLKVIPELSEFSSDQEKLVLEQINSRSHDDLSNTKGISIVQAKAILEHRMKNGPLTSLPDLSNIKGFGKGFFRNLLQADCVLPMQRKKKKLSNLLSPLQKKNVSSLVSIDIGLNNAAFVHIDRNKYIHDWKRISIPVPRPYNPVDCKKSVENIVNTLPDADVYIIELQSHRASRADPVLFPFVLHLRIVEAMIHCLLKDKLVFDINPLVTARYFGLHTGLRKKKAAVDLVSFMIKKTENVQLMEESPDVYFEKATKIEGSKETVSTLFAAAAMSGHEFDKKWRAEISDELLEYFMSQKKKDDLSDCLLQALAFLDLAF